MPAASPGGFADRPGGRIADHGDEPRRRIARLRHNVPMSVHPNATPRGVSAADAAPSNPWDRYLPWRRVFEVGFWIANFTISAIGNSATAVLDVRRAGMDVPTWAPMVWEWSSALVGLALVPTLVWFTRRVPLHLDNWRRALPLYVLGSVAWSILHVAGMVALRKLAYAAEGLEYHFSPWLLEFGYEYLKDVRSFASMVAGIEIYRWFLRRLQGEASVLAQADDLPQPDVPPRPERFLVRKLGKEFLVSAAEVEWLQASGNYVNLHVRGRAYPLRTTMAAIEAQLDPARFVRVHRSHIVNLDCVAEIRPLETGDARIVMRDGAEVPCSRRHRDALRPTAA